MEGGDMEPFAFACNMAKLHTRRKLEYHSSPRT